MRHLKRNAKLGRTSEHRTLMLANMVCSLIKHRRITTTLKKAKVARSVAEKLVTLGKSGTIHDRRLAASRLRQEDAVKILFGEIAPTFKDRKGGYTRIVKISAQRRGDAAEQAILEWVTVTVPTTAPAQAAAQEAAPASAVAKVEAPVAAAAPEVAPAPAAAPAPTEEKK